MADHTPGPWSLVDATRDHGAYVECPVTGSSICDLYWMDGDRVKHHLNPEANARLIAAAPDLLEALQEINDWLVCACIVSAEDMAQSFPDMQQVAAIAIARATGEK